MIMRKILAKYSSDKAEAYSRRGLFMGKGEAPPRWAERFARSPKRTDGKAARVTRRLLRSDVSPTTEAKPAAAPTAVMA